MGERVGLLQFADDILILFQKEDTNAKRIMRLLQLFEEEAGQTLNETKSGIVLNGDRKQSQKQYLQYTWYPKFFYSHTISGHYPPRPQCDFFKSLITKVDRKLEGTHPIHSG